MGQIKITQTRSKINRPERQKRILQALGLKRLNQSVIHEDTKVILGMVNKVSHLVVVETIK